MDDKLTELQEEIRKIEFGIDSLSRELATQRQRLREKMLALVAIKFGVSEGSKVKATSGTHTGHTFVVSRFECISSSMAPWVVGTRVRPDGSTTNKEYNLYRGWELIP